MLVVSCPYNFAVHPSVSVIPEPTSGRSPLVFILGGVAAGFVVIAVIAIVCYKRRKHNAADASDPSYLQLKSISS